MWKKIGLALLGFLLFACSVILGYLYLRDLDAGGHNVWLFIIPTFLCLVFSAVSLLIAGRSNSMFFTDSSSREGENDPSIATIGVKGAVEKHNFLVSQWRKNNSMQDKMKMIKITAATQQKPKF